VLESPVGMKYASPQSRWSSPKNGQSRSINVNRPHASLLTSPRHSESAVSLAVAHSYSLRSSVAADSVAAQPVARLVPLQATAVGLSNKV
jgi:hypothetical protein